MTNKLYLKDRAFFYPLQRSPLTATPSQSAVSESKIKPSKSKINAFIMAIVITQTLNRALRALQNLLAEIQTDFE